MRFASSCLLALNATALLFGAAQAQPETPAALRKALADPKAEVRLRAALALAPLPDERAIGVLIDLLTELSPEERRQAEQMLQQLAGAWSPNLQVTGEDELSRKIRRAAWAAWWRTVDGPTLLNAFRRRTLDKDEWPAAQALLKQLADQSATQRDRATAELIAMGSKAIGLLHAAGKSSDAEQTRRIDFCLQQIALNEARDQLPLSAPRLLAARQPAGASAALLAYLASTDDRTMKDEIGKALASLVRAADTADAAVLEALSDSLAARRIAAAEALAAAGGVTHLPAVRKLLNDAEAEVRLRVALALVNAFDKETVPALIDLLAEFPRSQLWEAEDLLQRLAGAKSPAVPPGLDDAATRKQLRAAWQGWWKAHGAAVNMLELEKTRSGGLTVVLEKTVRGAAGPGALNATPCRLLAVDRSGQPRWQIDSLGTVYDFQMLPGERVLIAEYTNRRITERDSKGNILWEVANLTGNPVNVQRLANGNTFIVSYGLANNPLIEVDAKGQTVASFHPGGAGAMPPGMAPGPGPAAGPGGFGGGIADFVLAAHKMTDGKMACLMIDGSCVLLDATGKELKRFPAAQAKSTPANTIGGIDVTPKGNVLFAQRDGSVVEYDKDGKTIWQAKASGIRAARLSNGNTLLATASGVLELDAAGQRVWNYDSPAGFEPVRARRQ